MSHQYEVITQTYYSNKNARHYHYFPKTLYSKRNNCRSNESCQSTYGSHT